MSTNASDALMPSNVLNANISELYAYPDVFKLGILMEPE